MKNTSFFLFLLFIFFGCNNKNAFEFQVTGVSDPVINLNGNWEIDVAPPAEFWKDNSPGDQWKTIQVPGEAAMQGKVIKHDRPFAYRKQITIPADFKEKNVLLQFDGVYSYARVWVNGNYVRDHHGGFTRWACDITPFVEAGKEAWISVEVTDRADEISYASGYAKHQIGGILRDVHLLALPQNYPEELNVETDFDEDFKNADLRIFGKLKTGGKDPLIKFELFDANGEEVTLGRPKFESNGKAFSINSLVKRPLKWDAEHPNLYKLKVRFYESEELLWQKAYKIGFREVEIKGNELLVNGSPVKLRGACRHDIHPLLGRVSTPDYELKDVKLAKEANMNFIRTSHYPPTDHFLSLCDEYGLYVEDETAVCFVGSHRMEEYYPGASESDPAFTDRYLSQLKEMVNSHRNHPSVIFWSVGNENAFGTNFKLSYDWVKKNDTSRPAIFSYPGYVPDSIKSYDILSMHYPGISGDMNQIGKKTEAFGYSEMPVIFDEWAHVACYDNFTVMEDPNIRSFWGQSLDSMWQKVFEADGGLGGAIWGMIDETFMLPEDLPGFNDWWGKIDANVIPAAYEGNTVGYGEWGIIDTWRRKKPEFWNTKKAYSPVKLLQTVFNNYKDGVILEIPVYNRFDHTNLNELTVKWKYKDVESTLEALDLKPRQKGNISIPLQNWSAEEPIFLNFYDAQNRLVDSYTLHQKKVGQLESPEVKEGNISVEESDDKVIIQLENNKKLVFDKKTGLLGDDISDDISSLSGPYLNLRTKGKSIMYSYHEINEYGVDWKLEDFSYKQEGKDVLVSIKGEYSGKIEASFEMKITPDGTLGIKYTIDNPPDEWIREAGIKFICEDVFDQLSWEREGYWSTYPENHLSSLSGTTHLYPEVLSKYREEPKKEWVENVKSFYYDGTVNESADLLKNIACAMKEDITNYSLLKNDRKVISVFGNGDVACRLDKKENKLGLYISNQWDYVDLSWGNYQKNIKIDKGFSGEIKLMINATP